MSVISAPRVGGTTAGSTSGCAIPASARAIASAMVSASTSQQRSASTSSGGCSVQSSSSYSSATVRCPPLSGRAGDGWAGRAMWRWTHHGARRQPDKKNATVGQGLPSDARLGAPTTLGIAGHILSAHSGAVPRRSGSGSSPHGSPLSLWSFFSETPSCPGLSCPVPFVGRIDRRIVFRLRFA